MPMKQTSVTQIGHLLQTAEAIRRDGKPEWMQVCTPVTAPEIHRSCSRSR